VIFISFARKTCGVLSSDAPLRLTCARSMIYGEGLMSQFCPNQARISLNSVSAISIHSTLQRTLGWCLVSPPVPVTCVGRISLFAVQVGMNPGSCRAFVLLGRFVCLLPIAFGIPLHPREGKTQFARRLLPLQGIAELLQCHRNRLNPVSLQTRCLRA